MGALLSTAALAFVEQRSRREFAARTAHARRVGRTAAEVQQQQQQQQEQQPQQHRQLVTGWMNGHGDLAFTHPLAQLSGVALSLQLVAVLWLACEWLATALTMTPGR